MFVASGFFVGSSNIVCCPFRFVLVLSAAVLVID